MSKTTESKTFKQLKAVMKDRLCNEFSVKSQREPVRGGT